VTSLRGEHLLANLTKIDVNLEKDLTMWGKSYVSTSRLPRVNDYAAARHIFDQYADRAKRGDDTRRWLRLDNRTQWIQGYNDRIAFVYRDRELIVYHANNEIVIDLTGSENSDRFINAICPKTISVNTSSTGLPSHIVGIESHDSRFGDTFWSLPRYGTLRLAHREGGWAPISRTEAFIIPEIDRKAAREALKASGVKAFFAYAEAVVALGGWARAHPTATLYMHVKDAGGRAELLEALKDESLWMDVLTSPTLTDWSSDADTALRQVCLCVRQAVYAQTPGVITMTEHATLDGHGAIKHWVHANKAYKYARRR
jgi:hypothetical protein